MFARLSSGWPYFAMWDDPTGDEAEVVRCIQDEGAIGGGALGDFVPPDLIPSEEWQTPSRIWDERRDLCFPIGATNG